MGERWIKGNRGERLARRGKEGAIEVASRIGEKAYDAGCCGKVGVSFGRAKTFDGDERQGSSDV